jgi:hypothetical protein
LAEAGERDWTETAGVWEDGRHPDDDLDVWQDTQATAVGESEAIMLNAPDLNLRLEMRDSTDYLREITLLPD